jgi:hypothetical protein
MKKYALLLTIALLSTTLWSQNWVALQSVNPEEPVINVTHSNNQHVSLTFSLSGFYTKTITEAGVDYQRLSIPANTVAGNIGEPEIPVIKKFIAVPECSRINYSVQVNSVETLSNYRVYPVPDLQQNGK